MQRVRVDSEQDCLGSSVKRSKCQVLLFFFTDEKMGTKSHYIIIVSEC